jgi:hypothetical protein
MFNERQSIKTVMVPQSSAQVSVTPCPTHDLKLDRFEKIWIALLKNIPHSYKTMEVLEKAWAEVQAKCAYLAVLK